MRSLVILFELLIASTISASELRVTPVDYWTVELECDAPFNESSSLRARTTIVQPQGFTQVVETDVALADGKARWRIAYPMIDEGRFDVQPGNWNGYWEMGSYHFRAELLEGERSVGDVESTFDPMSVCQRDSYGPIFSTYPHQFIECSPVRPAYIDTDEMKFTIRTIRERVANCSATVDVTARGDDKVLAGPWNLELGREAITQEFDSANWPRGEYWIRIRVHKNGEAVGPYVIRKVWKEILPPVDGSSDALRVRGYQPMMATSFPPDVLMGTRFVVDALEKKPDGPLFVMDKPWETELLYYKTLHRDAGNGKYVLEYELAGGEKKRAAERAQLPTTICRAISKDGLTWTKPSLGLVTYRGSTDNNLVPADKKYVPPRPGTLPAAAHDFGKATFRFYDADKDGHINMQNVFVTAVKESFANQCTDESSHAFRTGAWPMEKRADEYLVLTGEPILYVGAGMDLFHSTEKITLHVEDRSTGKLFYFFRPGSPSYPPHHAAYDNMHMTRRCLGVMWTSDGLHWDRRLIAAPDEYDAPATQFYYNTLYNADPESAHGRPAMTLEEHWNKVAVDGSASAVACLTIFDARANQLWPELAAIDDLLHWRRFNRREKMIANGPEGSYDHGLIKIESHYHVIGNEWWFPYQAINTLHQDYIGLARMSDVEQLKREFPNYDEVPGFESWEQYWERCKSMRYYTGIARCRPGRVSHVEPAGREGSVTTRPIVLAGEKLLVNAATEPSGSVQAEVLEESGKIIPGFERQRCMPATGDGTELEVAWDSAEVKDLGGREVILRFHLDRAKLYGYSVN